MANVLTVGLYFALANGGYCNPIALVAAGPIVLLGLVLIVAAIAPKRLLWMILPVVFLAIMASKLPELGHWQSVWARDTMCITSI